MTIQHQPAVTKAFLWFPCVCKQHEQRLGWIATDKTTSSHLCVPLPHAPRLCRLLKVPLHGQCAHWKQLHVSQENTYPAVSASEIATSQAALCTVQLRAQKSPFFDGKRHLFSCPTPHYSAPTPQLRPKKPTFFRGKTPFLKHATE